MQPLLWICRALPALALMLGAAGAHAAERAIDKTVEVAATLDQTWSAWTTRWTWTYPDSTDTLRLKPSRAEWGSF